MQSTKTCLLILVAALFLGACNPVSAEQLAGTSAAETAEASSPTPSPTETSTPTQTPSLTPTNTLTPSDTPTETPTPTLTYTPTNPASPTPSLTPLPTQSPVPPTITPCPSDSKIFIENRTDSAVTITLFGPCIYVLSLQPGNNSFEVLAGYYDYSINMCGGVFTGNFTFKENGHYYVDCG